MKYQIKVPDELRDAAKKTVEKMLNFG